MNKKIAALSLEVTCDFKDMGCTKVLKLDVLDFHVKTCEYQPEKIVTCPFGCELVLERNKLAVSLVSSVYKKAR